MKGKINVKTIIVLVILVLIIVLGVLGINTVRTFMSGAAGGAEPQNVVAVSNEDGSTANVTWTSDKETTGIVEYGTNPASLILRVEETAMATSHDVTLNNLRSGVVYYYRIRVGEEIFDNNGAQYSFETKGTAQSSTSTISPTTPSTAPAEPVLKPTIALSPISTDSSVPITTKTSCNRTTDYNKDSVINSFDYLSCIKSGGTAEVPGSTSTITTAPVVGNCDSGSDYNKDGSINSLDVIKCLQDNKK